MVAIILILLLAAIALPTFIRVREASRRSVLLHDARQLGSAAQQYLLEQAILEVPLSIDSVSGDVGGVLGTYVKTVGKGYLSSDAIHVEQPFTLAHPHVRGGADEEAGRGEPVVFNTDGSLYR